LQSNKPSVTHTAAPAATFTNRIGCAVSSRQDVYWVGDFGERTLHKHNLTTGALISTIADVDGLAVVATVERRFVVLTSNGDNPMKVVDAQTDEVVATGDFDASDASVCDDGTIISASYKGSGRLATYSISDAGDLTLLADVANTIAISIHNTVCSPGSLFVLVAAYSGTVYSYSLDPLSTTETDSLALGLPAIVSLAFNQATSDLYLLRTDGLLRLYPFDSISGTFGVEQASTTVGVNAVFQQHYGVEHIQFAFDKLFVTANDQLFVYDALLNLISSDSVIAVEKGGVCVSEGMTCCVVLCGIVIPFIYKSFTKSPRQRRRAGNRTNRSARTRLLLAAHRKSLFIELRSNIYLLVAMSIGKPRVLC
jgi:hypothetical protein